MTTTYRERMERKAERRREWAAGRERKSEAARAEYQRIGSQWEFGQPILVGHHSEKRARRDHDRVWEKLGETVEHGRMAERHEQAADGIERALATSVFSDDEDAVERLTEIVAGLEAKRDAMKARNAAYRAEHRAELKAMSVYDRSQAVPFPSYSISNLGATIRQKKQRIEQITRERAMADAGQRGRGRQMESRYGGTCPDCGETFERGDQITWFRVTREATHAVCPTKEATDEDG